MSSNYAPFPATVQLLQVPGMADGSHLLFVFLHWSQANVAMHQQQGERICRLGVPLLLRFLVESVSWLTSSSEGSDSFHWRVDMTITMSLVGDLTAFIMG